MSFFNAGDVAAFAKAAHPLVSVLLHCFVEDYKNTGFHDDCEEYDRFVGDGDVSDNSEVESEEDHSWKDPRFRTDGHYYHINKFLDGDDSD